MAQGLNIFSLFGSIMIDNAQANDSLAKTDKKASSVGSTLSKGIKTAAKWGAAISGAATAAVGGMVKAATSAASTADNIDKMSQKIGVSREAYQELDYIMSQNGASVDSLKSGMKTLVSVMDNTAKGTSEEATALERLGISATDADGNLRSSEEVMWEAFSALQGMENQTEKARLATELFGKSGTDLMPMLNNTSASVENLKDEAHKLGLVMSDELVDNGVSLTDTLDKAKRSISALATRLGGALMPILNKAINFVIAQMPKIEKLIEKLEPILTQVFEQLLPPMMDLVDSLLPVILNLIEQLLPAISQIFGAITPIITALIQKLAPIMERILTELLPPIMDIIVALLPVLDMVLKSLDPIFKLVSAIITPLSKLLEPIAKIIEKCMSLVQKVLEPIQPIIEKVAELLGGVLGVAFEKLGEIVEGLTPILEGVMDFLNGDFTGGLQKAGEAFTNIFENALEGIDGLFGTHLADWYREVKAFWEDAGKKLYEVTHQDEIKMNELGNKYSSLQNDMQKYVIEQLRAGKNEEQAVQAARDKYLDTSEKLYYFDNALSDIFKDVSEWRTNIENSRAKPVDYWTEHYASKAPHLAEGGLAYAPTMAVVGDNRNASINPEVIAPLDKLTSAFENAVNKITTKTAQTITVVVQLADGTELTRALVNNINDLSRQQGYSVIMT